MLSEIEQANLRKIKEQIQSGQRSEDPTDPRWEFARSQRDKLLEEEFKVPGQTEEGTAIKAARAHLEQGRLGMPLREQAEDIRARVEARARGDSRAARSIIKDRANRVPVTRLRMRMETEGEAEIETINVGMVAGTGDGEEDGTVSISDLMIKRDQLGHSVESQRIEAKISRGGEFSIREDVVDLRKRSHDKDKNTYSIVYPLPNIGEPEIDAIVADEKEASILLKRLAGLVDSCLTNPNLSFSSKISHGRRALSQ